MPNHLPSHSSCFPQTKPSWSAGGQISNFSLYLFDCQIFILIFGRIYQYFWPSRAAVRSGQGGPGLIPGLKFSKIASVRVTSPFGNVLKEVSH
jgi:hypothetical protein